MTGRPAPGGGTAPKLPAAVPRLGPDAPSFARAAPATDGSLLVEGERVSVLASRRGAIDELRIDGRPVTGPVRIDLGTAANLVVAPGWLRREWVGRAGTVVETVVVARRLPLAAVQWSAGPAARLPDALSVRVTEAHERPLHLAPGVVVLGQGDRAIGIGTVPARTLRTEPGTGGGVVVRAGTEPMEDAPAAGTAGTVTLIVTAGSPEEVRRAFAATAHLPAHARGHDPGGLSIESDDGVLDEAFTWARHRLEGAVRHLARQTADRASPAERPSSRSAAEPRPNGHAQPADPALPDALWLGLAAVSVGDVGIARMALGALGSPPGADRATALYAGLLAARITRAFGDAPASASWARALLREPAGSAWGEGASDEALERLVLLELATALEGATDPETIERLRAAAEGLTSRSGAPARGRRDSGGDGGIRLPVVGTRTRGPADLLRSLLAVDPTGPAPDTPWNVRETPSSLRRDPDVGWVHWRSAVEEGLEHGPAGPGSWDDPWWTERLPSTTGTGVETASLLLSVSTGLLGITADAAAGRVRIAPRLPRALARLDARGIILGEASLDVSYRRDGGRHRISLHPSGGAVPATAVLEPAVAGAIAETLVDGRPADLDVRAQGGRWVVPVQLPVDGIRTLEIVTG